MSKISSIIIDNDNLISKHKIESAFAPLQYQSILQNYVYDSSLEIWASPDFNSIPYSDGDRVEAKINSILDSTSDLSVLSSELQQKCTDWETLYHFSQNRVNILRPFENLLAGNVLEIGAGCGAITRYLGECGANVLALEGSRRRAGIARKRTRDLSNVTVIAEKFEDFVSDQKFDVITLIGVLEYAQLFSSLENPVQSMLARIHSLLKADGKLIIAIENQLGLKYFAGALEDHVRQSMYGLEDRYETNQAQTFGRKVLEEKIKDVGFSFVEFLAPFPDYKFPASIVTEKGFATKGFDAAAFPCQSVHSDPQLTKELLSFAPELVWPTIVKNGLAMDLSNSFLIVAHGGKILPFESPTLAWHFSSRRHKKYCKMAHFLATDNNSITIKYKSLVLDHQKQAAGKLISFSVPEQTTYTFGKLLITEMMKIVTSHHWSVSDLCSAFIKYFKIISSLSDIQFEVFSTHNSLLPGVFFDRLPHNIIVKDNESACFIDQEWIYKQPLEAGYLVYRTLCILVNYLTRFGEPADNFPRTNLGLIQAVMDGLNWKINKEILIKYNLIENKVQDEIRGRTGPQRPASWVNNPIIIGPGATQMLSKTLDQVYILQKVLREKDAQIYKLKHMIALRDNEIKKLVEKYHSRISGTDPLANSW